MKRLISFLLVLALLPVLAFSVFAAEPKVVDQASLLAEDDAASLTTQAQRLTDQYQMDVVILTIPSLNGRYIESYADDYYDSHGYGVGEDFSGVLLLIVMDTREWAISTCGKAIAALPDRAIDDLFDVMADDLSNGDYSQAFEAYLTELEDWFRAYWDDQTVDAGDYLRVILVSLVAGAAVGGIAILVMRSQMNTAKAQSGAASYLTDGSFHFTRRSDIFLYSNVSRTRKVQNNSSTHSSSSGRSHGGGHGRF